jgi:hypothetical protein
MVADAGKPRSGEHTQGAQRVNGEAAGGKSCFASPANVITFGSAQYQWHPTKEGGFPDPDGQAVKASINANADTVYEIPKASMTVIRGMSASPPKKTHEAKGEVTLLSQAETERSS